MLRIAGAMRLLLLIAGAGAACTNTLTTECWRFVEWQATFFCTEEFCANDCPHAGGCDAWCGLCDDEPLVSDCNGHRAPSVFLGDGTCDAGIHRYDGELIDFNCPEHGCDGGDCQPGNDAHGIEVPCSTSAPTPLTPAPTQADTIASIQNSTIISSHFMDCRPSPRHHALVRVTCVVTLVTKVGFYCQDAAAPWSGIFVHAPYDALTLALQPGDQVSVRDAYVDEELGSTQLEVAAADDVEILQRYVTVGPLLVDAGALGSFAEREAARCLASAEPYEGLLVRITNASLRLVDGYVSVADGSGGTTLLGTTAGRFDAADALVRFRASGAAAVDVVGVGRTGFRCENSAGANQGAIEDVLECLSDASQISFTFQVSPRSLHDVSWDSPAPTPQPQVSISPTRPDEPHRSEASATRDHTMQSVTLGIALCAVVLGVAGGVLLMRPRTSQVDPGLRAWLSGLDPGDARWPQMAGVAGQSVSVEVQVARCPTTFDRGGVAVAECRAVPADAPVPVAAAVAIEMPVIGQRARSVEDAAVDEAMDELIRRGLIPANEPGPGA